MSQTNRRQVLKLGTAATALALLGADRPKTPFGKKEVPLKVEETVGDLAYVRAPGPIKVEGVGLVVGLEGTGSNPEPSPYREKLLNILRKAQVEKPEQILSDPSTSLVVVRGEIPAGITKDDVFDVELELTRDSGTTSLAGGTLLRTELAIMGVADGEVREGKVLAFAGGAVLGGSLAKPDDAKAGRVLGGAKVRNDMPYTMLIKENRKSVKTAKLLETVVASRFFYLDGVNQKGMATAKTDEYLVLRVPRVYHQNQARFFQVLQLLPIVEAPELRARRLEQWGQELLAPETAGVAALKLEGVGPAGVEALKRGLDHADLQVRFFAAEALAYLNDDAGADMLDQAARERPDFRAFALAAMAATDQPACLTKLRDLLAHPERELRYGAFNALRAQDDRDWALGKVDVLQFEPPPPPEDDADPMAYQLAVARKYRRRAKDPFDLYLVDCDGPPMIHVSNTRRAEIVVFGRRQQLLTPIVLGGPGSVLLNASLGDERVQIARVTSEDLDRADATSVTASLAVGDVVREAANLGVSYSEIIALLQAAERQKNLQGPLVIDAIPSAAEGYDRAQLAGATGDPADKSRGRGKTDPAVGKAGLDGSKPRRGLGLFDRLRRNRDDR